MKLLINTLALLLFFSASCESQENNNITLTYFAQTRGFIYSLQLKGNILEVNNNYTVKKISLSETQIKELSKILSETDFEKIENNISIEDLAVDKAIKGNFDLVFNQKKYSFEFDHHNLPQQIKQVLSYLDEVKE